MRILLAIQNLKLSLGGAERFTINLAKNLIARGHEVIIAAQSFEEGAEKLGAKLLKIADTKNAKDPWTAYRENLEKALSESAIKPDILLGLTQLYPQDIHRFGGGVYKKWLAIKYKKTFWLRRLFGRNKKILEFEEKIYAPENLRYAVAISKMDAALLHELYAFPKERIITIYNGIDQEEFHNRGRQEARKKLCETYKIPEEKRLVIFSANNYRRKGLPEAVKAILKTHDPSRFALFVLGKPDKFLRFFLKIKIGKKFETRWLSHVSNPADYYRGADLMIFPTQYDSFANVTGEALLCGLPLITTSLAGGAEMVQDGVNGFVVENNTCTTKMAAALDALLDEKTLHEFSANAPALAKELTWSRCAKEFEDLFQKVLEEKKL